MVSSRNLILNTEKEPNWFFFCIITNHTPLPEKRAINVVYAQLYAEEEGSEPYWIVSYMPLVSEDIARSAADCKKISDRFAKQYSALR